MSRKMLNKETNTSRRLMRWIEKGLPREETRVLRSALPMVTKPLRRRHSLSVKTRVWRPPMWWAPVTCRIPCWFSSGGAQLPRPTDEAGTDQACQGSWWGACARLPGRPSVTYTKSGAQQSGVIATLTLLAVQPWKKTPTLIYWASVWNTQNIAWHIIRAQ